jgi:hypothetical protein
VPSTNTSRSKPALSLVEDVDGGALERGPEGEPVDEQPLTTWQKVGIGVGAVAGTGVVAFGIYRLGAWAGWWGQKGGPIVIDESDAKDGAKPDNAKPDDAKPKPSDGGSSGSKTRALGKPPNISGDPMGYNTKVWPSPGPVRLALKAAGYEVPYSTEPLTNPSKPVDEQVRLFQRDWNRVINGIDSGKVKLPSDPADPSLIRSLRGLLDDDGVPGKNTLNALEIVTGNFGKNSIRWPAMVKESH